MGKMLFPHVPPLKSLNGPAITRGRFFIPSPRKRGEGAKLRS